MERRRAPDTLPQAPALAVEMRGVDKTYPGGEQAAVSNLDLRLETGQVTALLGPSGCGKTTALRIIAGLERPDAGTLWIDGKQVAGKGVFVPPEKRSVGMVFQDFALFPHLTVRGNVAYGVNRLPRAERRRRIEHVLETTELSAFAGRYPHELSGGQQQRVAIARAIAPRPSVVLLDEPFSNLDAGMRGQVRSEVLALLRAAGVTVLLVTHDQDEAFVAAESVSVMSGGRVLQSGSAEDLYYRPATRWVAQFVGIANFLPSYHRDGLLETPLGTFPSAQPQERPVDVMLRPEQLEVSAQGLKASVVGREFHGHDWLYVLLADGGVELRVIDASLHPLAIGQRVHVRARVSEAPAFAAEA